MSDQELSAMIEENERELTIAKSIVLFATVFVTTFIVLSTLY